MMLDHGPRSGIMHSVSFDKAGKSEVHQHGQNTFIKYYVTMAVEVFAAVQQIFIVLRRFIFQSSIGIEILDEIIVKRVAKEWFQVEFLRFFDEEFDPVGLDVDRQVLVVCYQKYIGQTRFCKGIPGKWKMYYLPSRLFGAIRR